MKMQIPGPSLRALGEGLGVCNANGCARPRQFKFGTRDDPGMNSHDVSLTYCMK